MIAADPYPDGERWTPLVDVSRLPLEPLSPDDDSVLGRSLRRVLDSLHDRNGVLSAFGSAFPED
ncbi:hypothetical protein GCM10010172_60890 [Paractinoplanes ferrugineus]|uniref:FXSXX-COOH protein n=1 Tax=Paractinoplanes ferrugineus TaxID=113564 RepID=A0A919MG91_9ACTN|nr:FxSxx-COOH cyclophane-containing RiPP peptide [Actinoplanes ferrugineus]GIE14583.1 hypothetical protein Afe05nite_64230 [Actinoplanes ferrugineus]